MRALSRFAFVAALLAVAACTSTYHPEYHPVTVTSYEQNVTASPPAIVGARGAPVAAPGPTLVAPPPPPPYPPPPWSAWPSE
jgi:hypothetical protein